MLIQSSAGKSRHGNSRVAPRFEGLHSMRKAAIVENLPESSEFVDNDFDGQSFAMRAEPNHIAFNDANLRDSWRVVAVFAEFMRH